jgi:thymidylate synthase
VRQYLGLLRHVREHGNVKEDRTGTGTLSVFGWQMRFDLAEGFPAGYDEATPPALDHPRAAVVPQRRLEHPLPERKRRLDLGRVGGRGGRSRPRLRRAVARWATPGRRRTIDQIRDVVAGLRSNPDSRRIIVCAWNVGELPKMALPPCHCLFQFYVAGGRLSCQLYQRSADIFLGVPFNIASYALLTHMVAQQTDLEPGEFIWTGGDCHLYRNHLRQADEQLSREPRPLPRLEIRRRPPSIFEYRFEDFAILDYDPHPRIAAPVAV